MTGTVLGGAIAGFVFGFILAHITGAAVAVSGLRPTWQPQHKHWAWAGAVLGVLVNLRR